MKIGLMVFLANERENNHKRPYATIRAIAQQKTTLMLVTHRVEEIIPEIESVVLLRRGRVVAAGPKRTTLTDARLSETFEAPIALTESGGYYAGAVRTVR